MTRAITLETIRAAAPAVYALARRTPLVRLDPLARTETDETRPATRIHLKLETLQPIGAFKIRGAANVVRTLSQAQLADGVWTVSAGNAAQGVALAARDAGAPCTVMVIDTAPNAKIRAIERLGARIVRASYDECWQTVERHQRDRLPGYFIHPFDDDRFISGNGTIGLEIVEQLPDVGAVVASVGGGGLLTGIATAVRALKPGVRIFAAEPETAAPLARSLELGQASYFPEWEATFVDGCGGKSVTPTMWPLLRDLVDASIVVSLDEIKRAMRHVASGARVIAEGAGACAVAAALSGRAGAGPIVAVVSGGNIDPSTFARILTEAPESDGITRTQGPGIRPAPRIPD
jgi:threonine dehydratase